MAPCVPISCEGWSFSPTSPGSSKKCNISELLRLGFGVRHCRLIVSNVIYMNMYKKRVTLMTWFPCGWSHGESSNCAWPLFLNCTRCSGALELFVLFYVVKPDVNVVGNKSFIRVRYSIWTCVACNFRLSVDFVQTLQREHMLQVIYMPYIDGYVQRPNSGWTVVTFATLEFEFLFKINFNICLRF